MSGCAKCCKVKSDCLVGCEGPCNKWFHYTCVGMTDSDLKTVQKFKNLLYVCDPCRRKCEVVETARINDFGDSIANIDSSVTALRKDFEKVASVNFVKNQIDDVHSKVNDTILSLKDNLESMIRERIQELQEVIIKSPTSGDSEPHSSTQRCSTSYAKAVKNPASNVVIVKPKDSTQTYAKTRSEILQNINPVESSLNVSKIKNVRDGGVVVGCTSKEDITKFKQLASDKLAGNYEIKELGSLNPRIRISGLTERHDPDMLTTFLRKQNLNVFTDNSSVGVIEVCSLKKNKNLYQAKLSLDIDSYRRAMREGVLFVGYDCCSVFDAVELRMCYKCCGFSHFAKSCNKNIACPKCSGDHRNNECNVSDASLFRCTNCISRGLSDVSHAAWSSCCPVRVEKLDRYKADMFNIK